MCYWKFKYLIEKQSLYFARTDAYEFDEYDEGVLTIIDKNYWRNIAKRDHPDEWKKFYEGKIKYYEDLKSKTYISCWADIDIEGIHLWKKFANLSEGIAIKTDVEKLKKEIERSDSTDDIYISKVKYIDPISGTATFNEKGIFARKITDFRVENEIRAIIQRSKLDDEVPDHIDVAINPENLVTKIVVSPLASNEFLLKIQGLLKCNKINLEAQRSSIKID